MLLFKKQKMASMTETQAELRLLMLRQRLLDQRTRMQTDSPLAKYSNGGLLPCDMPERNIDNSSFNEYINSKGSKKNISKSEQESSVMTLKRTLNVQESSAEPSKKIKTSPVASVPSSFFQGSTSSMKTNVDIATKEKVQKQPETLDDLNFNKWILSKGYDSSLLYPKIQSEKNSSDKELQKLYEQPIMVKTNGEFNGKFNYPLQIVDKQVEENEYLSNNSNNLISAVRTQSINHHSPWSSKISKRNISKRKVELSGTTDKRLVTINNRLKRALAKNDNYTSSKKIKVTPNTTVSSNFFESPALFSSSNTYFDQEINEEVEKQPVRSIDDPNLNPSLFTTIRNDSKYDSSSEEELPSFESNTALLNLSGRIMAETRNDLSEYFSSKQEKNDYAFWQRVFDMEKRRSTMGLSIASTTELMENMGIKNEVD